MGITLLFSWPEKASPIFLLLGKLGNDLSYIPEPKPILDPVLSKEMRGIIIISGITIIRFFGTGILNNPSSNTSDLFHILNSIFLSSFTKGKVFDMADEIRKTMPEVDNPSLKVYPVDGYGNPEMVRSIIPLGEDDPNHWWIYSFLINNRLQKK